MVSQSQVEPDSELYKSGRTSINAHSYDDSEVTTGLTALRDPKYEFDELDGFEDEDLDDEVVR